MTSDWCQYNLAFPDRETADQVTVHDLRPALAAAADAGLLRGWWFVRKQPWKLRFRTEDPDATAVSDVLEKLAADGRLISWTRGIYEPETLAFGGLEGMEIAHELFHHDSRYLLTRAASPRPVPLGERESAVVLCSVLLRAAGLDWFEQGDVWAKVAELRPAELGPVPPERADELAAAMHRLMTVNTRALADPAAAGPLTGYDGWIAAFERAGQALVDLTRRGRLERGLRAVAAHHIIFHANRAGLSLADQAAMAALAKTAVFGAGRQPASSLTTVPDTPKVSSVTTPRDNASVLSAEQLRDRLTDRLREQDIIRTADIEAAFRRIPRELFVPGVPLEEVYADSAVYTKHNGAGASISAASQPRIVAMMLRQLDLQPGHRVLEAGAGTGVNAAYMATIVGETGRVVTIDVDEDLVEGAREHLAAAGITNVAVVLGDGALGYPAGAPYNRFIATVGAFEVPTAWLEQLTPDGRLVVPLRLRGAASRSIAFERGPGGWRSVDSELAVFMPLRGGAVASIGDDTYRLVALTCGHDVTVQVHQDQEVDDHALAKVLDTDRHETWTGVCFAPMVSFEWLDLWLACRLEGGIMRMNVQPAAKERGQVAPMFGWGAMSTVRGGDLAYLTLRPATPAGDGGKLYEVGVLGHGPTGRDLAEQVAQEIRLWDAGFRDRAVRFEMPDAPVTADPDAGRFVLPRPHHPVTVIWE
jgi:protein-L-isoaspartate(D-aspartate) O-methyltransferase